jgi:mannose-6-phosphate isomerase-like protein (cupin superfamily)
MSGHIVKSSDVYTVIDNSDLSSLVVSKTILHPQKETTGHSHAGQEEVYQFVHGTGEMEVGQNKFGVAAGDVVLIPDGLFHKVWNTSCVEDLVFVCIFGGKRSHQ